MLQEAAVGPGLRGLQAAASRALIRAGLPASCSCVWIFPETASASESSGAPPGCLSCPYCPSLYQPRSPPLCLMSAQSLGRGSPAVPPPSLETTGSALAPRSHQHFVLRASGRYSSEAAPVTIALVPSDVLMLCDTWLLRWR